MLFNSPQCAHYLAAWLACEQNHIKTIFFFVFFYPNPITRNTEPEINNTYEISFYAINTFYFIYFIIEMGTRAAATSLARRTTFSSAINILPNELQTPVTDPSNNRIIVDEKASLDLASAKPYRNIPGPKELPIIGNSWRFAPIIGKLITSLGIYL